MAKLFIGIALVIMLATAALSFLAHGNIQTLQAALKETKGHIAEAEAKARTAKTDVEKAQKDVKDATDKADAATQQLADKAKETEEATNKLKELMLVSDAKDKQIADLTKAVADASGKPAAAPVDDPRIADLQKKLDDATKEASEAKQVVDSQTGHVKDMEAKLAAAELKERKRAQQFGAAGLQGRILAVNGGWNFVVLSVGDKQGVSINSPLLVVRGNEPIARLRITSVEPSTSIADVLPGSVRHGVTVQPGDTVIFEGGRNATPQQEPAAKPAADAASSGAVPPLPN